MQILRIILMVCFVFTAYTPIGEAVDIEAVDISKGSKKKSSSRAELPLGVKNVGAFESKENQEREASSGGFVTRSETLEWDQDVYMTPLNERILQLQKKELDKSLDTPTEDDGY